jgi:hypothetical protein
VMELGDLSMLSMLLPMTIHAGWLFQAQWSALFLTACQVCCAPACPPPQ